MPEKPDQPTDHQRGVRLRLCSAADQMGKAIDEIDGDVGAKGELANLVTLVLRMSLRLNDGHMSVPDRMKSW